MSSSTSLVTVSVVGQQTAKAHFVRAVNGGAPAAPECASVTVHDAKNGDDITVQVTAAPSVGITRIDDVLFFVCIENDQGSVRHLADRVWSILDDTPHWQPAYLVVVRPPNAAVHISSGGPSLFEGALGELDTKLDRYPRYYGVQRLALDASIVVSSLGSDASASSRSGLGATPSGFVTLAEMLLQTVDVVKAPSHVVWDRRRGSVTITGHRALRRAFWLLDKDADGYLNDVEIQAWHGQMYADSSDDDIDVIKRHLASVQSRGPVGGPIFVDPVRGITPNGFMHVCQAILSEREMTPVWSLLWATGIQHDGLPYTQDDMARVPPQDPARVVQLSHNGLHFFNMLYSPRRFADLMDMWEFVPECPWLGMEGMPAPHSGMTPAEFLSCWRVMAALDPAAVAQFAAHWGYRSDPGALFIERASRDHRDAPHSWPTTLQVLVLGSRWCGKSSLLQRLGSPQYEFDELAPPPSGAAYAVSTVPRDGEDVVLLFRELDESTVEGFVSDKDTMAAIDLVLLCYSATDSYSFSYIEQLVPMLVRYRNLPLAIAMTKAEQPVEDQLCAESPALFCRRYQLAWPPLVLSVCEAQARNLGLSNDIEALPFTLLDAIMCPDIAQVKSVTVGRLVWRAALVTTAAALLGFGVRKLLGSRRRE